MRPSQLAYGAMQAAIIGGAMWLHFRAVATNPDYTNENAMFPLTFGVVCAAIATAAVFWTHRGIRRLLGKRNPPLGETHYDDLRAFSPGREETPKGRGGDAGKRRVVRRR